MYILIKRGDKLKFEWNSEKNTNNKNKHGISFEDATLIFQGTIFTQTDSRKEYNEVREISIGELDSQVIITVIHKDRNNYTRIISAHLANRKERKEYYAYCKKIRTRY